MGWQKSEELETGVVVGFWKLISIYIDVLGQNVHCSYEGYIDQAAHDAGKTRLLERGSDIPFSVVKDTIVALQSLVETEIITPTPVEDPIDSGAQPVA